MRHALTGTTLLLCAPVALGDVLFNQSTSVPYLTAASINGFIAEPNQQLLADDFTLKDDSIVTEFRWFGAYRNRVFNPWVAGDQVAFTIALYGFSGANPNVAAFTSYTLNATVLGVAGYGYQNRPVYEFSGGIPDLSLAAATPYAVSILENDTRTRASEYLWALAPSDIHSVAWVFVDNGWRPEPGTTSAASAFGFQVIGSVPVPGSLAVLGLAAGWSLRPRRQ